MPLEIRELTIRVNVEPPASQPSLPVNLAQEMEEMKSKIITECMQKIVALYGSNDR